MRMKKKKNILIVDDSSNIRQLIAEFFRHKFPSVECMMATDGREAYDMVVSGDVDLVITDQHMPKMTGIELATSLRSVGWESPIILMTGDESVPKQGSWNVKLLKPFDGNELVRIARTFLT